MIWRLTSAALFAVALLIYMVGLKPEVFGEAFVFNSNYLGRFSAQGQSVGDWNYTLTLACSLFVFIWYVRRFGRWRNEDKTPRGFPVHPPRSFTTSTQYTSWAFFYGIVSVIAFLIAVFAPEFVRNILTLLDLFLPDQIDLSTLIDNAGKIPGRDQSHIYFLGFGMTLLGLFSATSFEGNLRNFFHRRAMIPREAENIFSDLKIDFHRKPIQDHKSVRDFIEFSRCSPEMPTYFDFELQVSIRQEVQNRLELLPRTEFMLWRLKQRGFSRAVDQRLDRHSKEIEKFEGDVASLRSAAMDANQKLTKVVEGLSKIDTASRGDGRVFDASDELQDFQRAAKVDSAGWQVSEIPVSRLDDVAASLGGAIQTMGERLNTPPPREYGAPRSGGLGPGPSHASIDVETVVSGLTPLCKFGLEAIDENLSEKQPKLRDLCDSILAFSICTALSASTRPDIEFLEDLGLQPRTRIVRFHLNRALAMVFAPLVFFLAILVLLGHMELDPDFFVLEIWLVLGGWMIGGSILHGSYHGSAIASLRSERRLRQGETSFTLLDCLSAYMVIWSTLIIGVFVISLAYEDPVMFSGAAPFAFLAAVWGVITAAVSMRTMLNQDPMSLVKEIPAALASIFVIIGLINVWASQQGSTSPLDLDPKEWLILVAIAGSLTVFLQLTIWVSIRKEQPTSEDSPPALA